MDRVLPFVSKAANENTPFLAVVCFYAPHVPVVAGPDHLALITWPFKTEWEMPHIILDALPQWTNRFAGYKQD